MKDKKLKKVKKNRINPQAVLMIFLSLLTIVLIYMYIRQRSVLAKLNEKYQEVVYDQKELEGKIKDLTNEIQEVNSLDYIEKKAREDLGMIKPNEKVYVNGKGAKND